MNKTLILILMFMLGFWVMLVCMMGKHYLESSKSITASIIIFLLNLLISASFIIDVILFGALLLRLVVVFIEVCKASVPYVDEAMKWLTTK